MPLQIDATLLLRPGPRDPSHLRAAPDRHAVQHVPAHRAPADADRQPRPGVDPGRAQPGAQPAVGRPDLPGAARPDRTVRSTSTCSPTSDGGHAFAVTHRAARGERRRRPRRRAAASDRSDSRRDAAGGRDRLAGAALAVAGAAQRRLRCGRARLGDGRVRGRAADGAAAVGAMRTLGIGGLAVTTPHKADVAAAVDEVDPAAAALRSVNTVVLRDDGSTFGASTDGAGFVDSLLAPRDRPRAAHGSSCSAPGRGPLDRRRARPGRRGRDRDRQPQRRRARARRPTLARAGAHR